MSDATQLVVFCAASRRHALHLDAVERATRAVEVTPLPGAPAAVLGAIDDGGRILPVFSLRRHLGLPGRALRLSDVFLIARTARRSVALLVDEVPTVHTLAAAPVDAVALAPGLASVRGVVRLDDGLVLIHDLERFLSGDDERALEAAMDRA